jgi:hypothetical protein
MNFESVMSAEGEGLSMSEHSNMEYGILPKSCLVRT